MLADLWTEIDRLTRLNEQRVQEMRRAGVYAAECEAEYRKALALAILDERTKGTPATLVRDVCRGRDEIAKLKLDQSIAETHRDSYHEEINANKIRIRVLDEQLKREWSQAGDDQYAY